MAEIGVLLTYDFEPELAARIEAVDPRVHAETLGRAERRLVRGESLAEDEDAAGARRSLDAKLARTEVILGWPDLNEHFLSLAPGLRWVHVTSAGIDTLLGNPVFHDGRITVTNSSGVSAPAIGEYIVMTMLMLGKQQPRFLRQQLEHRWQRHRTPQLEGRTLGIVGMGAIGEEAAKRARAFGTRILAIRRSVSEPRADAIADQLLPPSALPQLLAESDYVALCVPLTSETDGLIGEAELQAMKDSAYLINISRGPVIDEAALIRALKESWIAGAALDVFDEEPLPPESPLWDLENLIITPHISGAADRHNDRITDLFIDNLRRYLAGEPLRNVIDPKLGY